MSNNPALEKRLADLLKLVADSEVQPARLIMECKNIPTPVAVAFMTQRPQFLRLQAVEALTADQVKDLYDFIATLIETNHALQQHAHQLAELVNMWMQALRGLWTAARRIELFGNFRSNDLKEEGEDT